MTPSDEMIRTTHLPQFGGIYFDLNNENKIFLIYDANKNIKKLKRLYYILLYEKNL